MKQSLKSAGVRERFNWLITDLLHGCVSRNSFKLWEADILLDIMSCQASGTSMRRLLRMYRQTVLRQLSRGEKLPMRFSDYMRGVALQ